MQEDRLFRQVFCVCRMVFEKVFIFLRHISKKCHYDSERDRRKSPLERRNWCMENSQELIGVLQAISIVAKKLAEKLMRIDREIKDYEAARTGTEDSRKSKKGWK